MATIDELARKTAEKYRKENLDRNAEIARLLASRPKVALPLIPPALVSLHKEERIVIPANVQVKREGFTTKKGKKNDVIASNAQLPPEAIVRYPGGEQSFKDTRAAFLYAQEIRDDYMPQNEPGDPVNQGFFSETLPPERSTLVRVWVRKYFITRKGDKIFVGLRPHFPDGVQAPTAEGLEASKPPNKTLLKPVEFVTWLVIMDSGERIRVQRPMPEAGGEDKILEELEKQGKEIVLQHHVGQCQSNGSCNVTAKTAILAMPTGEVIVRRDDILKSGCTISQYKRENARGETEFLDKRKTASLSGIPRKMSCRVGK